MPRHSLNKTHCTNGHEYTPENRYILKSRPTYMCRICRYNSQKRYRESIRPPVQYKTKTEIALDIARADYKMSFYNRGGYEVSTYESVMHSLREIENE